MDAEQQRRLALELRERLGAVISDEQTRQKVEDELDAALALPTSAQEARLTEVLAARAETRVWMRERDLELFDPVRLVEQGGLPTAGDLGTYFVCPNRDYAFVREKLADIVPPCPHHGLALVAQDAPSD